MKTRNGIIAVLRDVTCVIGVSVVLTGILGCAKEPLVDSRKADLHYRLSGELLRQQRIGPALREARLAVRGAPENPRYYNLLGIILFAKREMTEAESAFLKAISLDDRYSEAKNNLGTLYIEANQWAKAEKMFRAALENPLYLNPEKAHTNLGYVYKRLGRRDQARKEFQQALSFDSGFYLANLHLGRLAFEDKNYDQASRYFKRATQTCEECIEAFFKLGFSYLQTNQSTEARQAFQTGHTNGADSYYGKKCEEYKKLLDTNQPVPKAAPEPPAESKGSGG